MTSPADDSNPLIAAAREWYDAGYCVVPSHEDGSKRPFGHWKNYQYQRLQWDDLVQLLNTGKYTGIGVITGKVSGNVELIEIEGPIDEAIKRLNRVVDEAAKYDEVGMSDVLARIARGCVESSAGGGMHFLNRSKDGPVPGNKKLAADRNGNVIAETRGEGGFVIVAPTPARNGHDAGTSYMFVDDSHPSKTAEISSEERDMIHLLFEMALNEHHEPPQPVKKNSSIEPTGDSTFDQYRATPWRDILEPQGWTYAGSNAGRDQWVRPGKNPSEGISATTIDDGPMYVFSTNAGLPSGRGLSKAHVYAHYHHNGDLSAAARDLAAQGYGAPVIVDLNEFTLPDDATPEQIEKLKNKIETDFPPLDWEKLWASDYEEEWICEPLLAARRLVALYSAPKVGKSLLMLEIAAGIASGKSIFGYPAQPPRRVLYIDMENDPQGDIRTRLIDMGYEPHELGNLVYLSFPQFDYFDTKKGGEQLLAVAQHYGVEVVVIDTVSRVIGGEENANDTWLNFNRLTGVLMKRAGISMIRLDHAGKDEAKGQRGGSAKSGDVDAVWRLRVAGDDLIEMECEARRFQIAETWLTLKRKEGPLRHEIESNPGRVKRAELLRALAQAGVPKDASLTVAAARKLAREHNVSFKQQVFNKEAWEAYCASLTTWEPAELGVD